MFQDLKYTKKSKILDAFQTNRFHDNRENILGLNILFPGAE